MKKLVTLLVAMVMVMAMSVTAFADGETKVLTEDSPITVTVNAMNLSETISFTAKEGQVLTIQSSAQPYTVSLGMTSEMPDMSGVYEVTIPSDGDYTITIDCFRNMEATCVVTLGDESAAVVKVGTWDNPEVISMGKLDFMAGVYNSASLSQEIEADSQGYFYTWTAVADGVVIYMDATYYGGMPEGGMAYDVALENYTNSVSGLISESETGSMTALSVKEGDVVNLIMSANPVYTEGNPVPTYPAVSAEGTIMFYGYDEENVVPVFEENTYELVLIKGVEVYYKAVAGTTLKVTGDGAYVKYNEETFEADENGIVSVEIVEDPDSFSAPVVVIGNKDSQYNTAKYTIEHVYPIGSSENPEVVEDLENIQISLEKDKEENFAYSYLWTAIDDGELYFMVEGTLEELTSDITLTITDAEGNEEYVWYALSSGDEVGDYIVYVLDVNKGDVVQMDVASSNIDYDDNYNAIYVEVDETIIPVFVGESATPISRPADLENVVIKLPAGAEAYYSLAKNLDGAVLTVNGKGAYVTVYGETQDVTYKAVDGVVNVVLDVNAVALEIGVENSTDAYAEFTASLAYPAGHKYNPIGLNNPSTFPTKVELEAGADINYKLGANFDGAVVTVTGENGSVVVNGEPVAIKGTVEVTLEAVSGVVDVAFVNEGTKDATYTVALAYPAGHVNNPIAITNPSTLTEVKVPAKGDVNYNLNSNFDGAILTVTGNGTVVVNGEVVKVEKSAEIAIETVNGVAQVAFLNDTAAEITYKVSTVYPEGHMSNPIEINNPSTLTEVKVPAAGNVNYDLGVNFNGAVLTVTGNGTVVVNGKTVKVEKSAEIAIETVSGVAQVAFMNDTAAEITYKVSTAYPEGHMSNPIEITNPSTLADVKVPANGNVNYSLNSNFDGAILTVVGNGTVVVNGEPVKVEESAEIVLEAVDGTVQVAFLNDTDKEVTYEVEVGYPAGNVNNPLHLERPASMDEKVALEAGEEFWYSYGMAFEGAVLTVEGENAVVVVNGTAYEAKDGAVEVVLPENVQSIVVGFVNEGTKAAEYAVSLTLPDVDTGDTTTLLPVIMMVLAAVAFVAVVDKKRKMA